MSDQSSLLERLKASRAVQALIVYVGAAYIVLEVVETLGKKHDLLAVPGCMFDESLGRWLRVAWSIPADKFAAAMVALDALLSDLR